LAALLFTFGLLEGEENDLSLGGNTQPPAPSAVRRSAVATAASPPRAARLNAAPAKGQSQAEAWDAYFASAAARLDALDDQARAPAVREFLRQVRRTSGDLMQEKEFAQVAVLLQAALRHGHVEPWMYDGLGLALQAAQAPAEEVERALLSAADFADSPEDLMYVAAYMDHSGLHRRALDLLVQATRLPAPRREAYVKGLAIAQKLDDVAAIEWACAGILAQAWPQDQQQIGEHAYRVGKATYERLIADGRDEEARAFENAVREASQRDCLVMLSWTGDADVDIAVEEPSGTLCSYRYPQSAGGGTLIGDTLGSQKKSASHVSSETYVCPQAFSGEYKIYIRSVWGKVAAGKVTVDIVTHHLTEKSKTIHEQVPLGDKDALVLFAVKEGRRQEPLPEAQVAQVARVQNGVNRAILAQQLAVLDQTSLSQSYAAQAAIASRLGIVPRGFFGRGAVGYRPVITQLPEGASFRCTAVISADRRYVRASPTPLFSQVTDVNTFNFVSGQGMNTGQGNTQGGGIGFGGAGGVGGGGGGIF
jgi:hypothetical protein